MVVFGDPWKRLFLEESLYVDWDGVWQNGLELAREINRVCGPEWTRRGGRKLLDSERLAVDVWVNSTLHAGTFELDDRASVLLQAGVLNVIYTFPGHVAQVALCRNPTGLSEGVLDALAAWIDHAASQGEMLGLSPGGDAPAEQLELYVRTMSRLALAFVLAHELAHLYLANPDELSLHDASWEGMTSLERRHQVEYVADELALDGVLNWARTWSAADAGQLGRTTFTAAWILLRGFALLETYDNSLVPTLHPPAHRRIARLRSYAQRVHGDITKAADALAPDVDRMAGAALGRAEAGRGRARDVLEPVLTRIRKGGVSRRRVDKAIGEAMLASESETTKQILALFRTQAAPGTAPDREALYDVLMQRLPVARFNNFLQLCAAEHLEWQRPRRRLVMTQVEGGA